MQEASSQRLRGWQVIVIILVVLAMLGGGFIIYRGANGGIGSNTANTALPANTQLATVQTGDIVNSVSASGAVAFTNRDQLSFNVSGTVDQVNVEDGDTVKKGQVLAVLDKISTVPLELAVAQARVNLKTAQDDLTEEQTPYDAAAFNQAKLAVANAQVAVNTAEDNLDKAKTPYTQADIDSAKLAVASAQVALNASQTNLDKAKTPYTQADIDAAKLAVENALVAANIAGDNLDTAKNPYTQADIDAAKLAISNAQAALKTAQDNLAKAQAPYTQAEINTSRLAVTNAEIALKTAQINFDNAFNIYIGNETADNLLTYQQRLGQLNVAKDNLTAANKTLNDMLASPDLQVIAQKQAALVVAQNNLAKAQQDLADKQAAPDPQVIAQKQAALVVAQNNLAQAQDDLAGKLAAPDTQIIAQKQAALVVAQNNLAQAQQDLTDRLAAPDPMVVDQKQASLVIARDNLTKAKQDLADMQPDALAIALHQAKVTNALETLNEATDSLNTAKNADVTIKAPYDGIITTLNLQNGQKVNAGANVMEIASPAASQVNAVINEVDYPNVKVGQPVSISVDAIPNASFTGNVSELSLFGKTTQGVVSFPVTVSVDAQPGIQLGEGMSATASIFFSQATNVLIIPNRAISGNTANPTVRVMVNGILETRPVTLGLTDGTQTEVISGLQAGDRVLEAVTGQQRGTGGMFIQGSGNAMPGGRMPAGGVEMFRSP